eukprot:gene2828-3513_t
MKTKRQQQIQSSTSISSVSKKKKDNNNSSSPPTIERDEDYNPIGIRNNDYCDACGDGGSLLCCDQCEASFHLICLNPPFSKIPKGDWFCNNCIAKKQNQNQKSNGKITSSSTSRFGVIIAVLTEMNPKCFELPSEYRLDLMNEISICTICEDDRNQSQLVDCKRNNVLPTLSEKFTLDFSGNQSLLDCRYKPSYKDPFYENIYGNGLSMNDYYDHQLIQELFGDSYELLIKNGGGGAAAFVNNNNNINNNSKTQPPSSIQQNTKNNNLEQLLKEQRKLSVAAMPSEFGILPLDVMKQPIDSTNPFIMSTLSPLFTQFLAWQRLMQINSQVFQLNADNYIKQYPKPPINSENNDDLVKNDNHPPIQSNNPSTSQNLENVNYRKNIENNNNNTRDNKSDRNITYPTTKNYLDQDNIRNVNNKNVEPNKKPSSLQFKIPPPLPNSKTNIEENRTPLKLTISSKNSPTSSPSQSSSELSTNTITNLSPSSVSKISPLKIRINYSPLNKSPTSTSSADTTNSPQQSPNSKNSKQHIITNKTNVVGNSPKSTTNHSMSGSPGQQTSHPQQQQQQQLSPLSKTMESFDGLFGQKKIIYPEPIASIKVQSISKSITNFNCEQIDIYSNRIIIGKSGNGFPDDFIDIDLFNNDNSNTLNQELISHFHAYIEFSPKSNEFYIVNLSENGTKVNGISMNVQHVNIREFTRFGMINSYYRSLFLRSKKWYHIDLSFMTDRCHNKNIYRLASTLNQYHDRGYSTPFILELNLNNLMNLTDDCWHYINNCKLLSQLESLSIINCRCIRKISPFFRSRNRESSSIKQLGLPILDSSDTILFLPYLRSVTSITLPGALQRMIFLRYLESMPNLITIKLSVRSLDNLFNGEFVLEKFCQLQQMRNIYFNNMGMSNDNFQRIALSMPNLICIHITQNFNLTGDTVNLLLESCKNLEDLNDVSFDKNHSSWIYKLAPKVRITSILIDFFPLDQALGF